MAGQEVSLQVLSLLVLIASLCVHEAAHAWSAFRLGDPTARDLGRLSLNPAVHVDPLGTFVLPAIALAVGAPVLGWAKPVPVNVRRLHRGRRDFVLVSAAGPGSNLLLAIACAVGLAAYPGAVGEPSLLEHALFAGIQINLLLALFNMIPLPPLDGGNVLAGVLPARLLPGFERLRPWGIPLLYGLMLTGGLGMLIGPPFAFLLRMLVSI
ncbi:MAG TPA: site-2 protease family protein [Myxococcota bacterium]|nr:site-2 protease family protein [Myxococcota bacterium]